MFNKSLKNNKFWTTLVVVGIITFIFVLLDYKIPAFISIGALYVQLLAFFITYKYYSKRM